MASISWGWSSASASTARHRDECASTPTSRCALAPHSHAAGGSGNSSQSHWVSAPGGWAISPASRPRLADDPPLWASTLFAELTALGYAGSYPSFTRALRTRKLRPHCEPGAASRGRDAGLIAPPPGAETQWDWLELPDPPAAWEWGASAHLLVGVLAHSSRWRAVLAEAEDQPQLIEAIDAVVRRLGGVSHRWRFDRMTTVCYPGSGRLTASFAPVAIHYGAGVDICPGRHGNRKGVVEKGNHSLAHRAASATS